MRTLVRTRSRRRSAKRKRRPLSGPPLAPVGRVFASVADEPTLDHDAVTRDEGPAAHVVAVIARDRRSDADPEAHEADAAVPVADGHTGSIPYPTLTRDFHYEIELVVAIGKGGSQIAAADAVNHIYGYAVGLDMTRRDLQSDMKKAGRPWSIGKGFDHSAPIGPIHPRASTGEIQKGGITLKVNGQMRQNSDVSLLIWNVAETIEQLSKGWTLQPGDLIFTGTPAGIGPVVSGDVMEGAIDGLGTLRVAVA